MNLKILLHIPPNAVKQAVLYGNFKFIMLMGKFHERAALREQLAVVSLNQALNNKLVQLREFDEYDVEHSYNKTQSEVGEI